MTRRVVAACLALVSAFAAAGCSGDDGPKVVVYNAQHEQLLEEIAPKFEEKTGIEVELRNGSDPELAAQLIQEGEASPADVFLTENSPSIGVVDEAGLLAPLDPSTLEQVGEQYRPASGTWVGFAARSTALIHNPAEISEDELPASMLDLAGPEWEGRIGIAAGGADFQAIVSAVLAIEGEDATREWLTGLERNAEIYASNTAIMKAVDEGEVPVGITYHYYWFRDQAQNGLIGDDAKLHYFGDSDPGAFVSISGAGVLASSDQPEEAQRLVAYLTGREAQEKLAESSALEYAVGTGVASAEALPPLETLGAPAVDPGSLNAPQVTELMQEVGLL